MSVIQKCGMNIILPNQNMSTSTAKHIYSFSKAERFPPLKTAGYSQNFYELPSTISKRYTKFGFGERSDFTNTTKIKKKKKGEEDEDSGKNDKKEDAKNDKPVLHGPAYTFSNGREKYGKVYLDTAKIFDKDVPGPGKYYYLKPFGSEAPKYSIKGKHDEDKKKDKDKKENTEEGANEKKEPEQRVPKGNEPFECYYP